MESPRREIGSNEKDLISKFVSLYNGYNDEADRSDSKLMGELAENPAVANTPNFNFELGEMARVRKVAADISAILLQHTGLDIDAEIRELLQEPDQQ